MNAVNFSILNRRERVRDGSEQVQVPLQEPHRNLRLHLPRGIQKGRHDNPFLGTFEPHWNLCLHLPWGIQKGRQQTSRSEERLNLIGTFVCTRPEGFQKVDSRQHVLRKTGFSFSRIYSFRRFLNPDDSGRFSNSCRFLGYFFLHFALRVW